MAGIAAPTFITDFDLYTTNTTAIAPIGQMARDDNTGKIFRYALAGASNLVAGNLLQEAVRDTQFVNMAVTATPAGSPYINVTNGTTTVVPAQYIGGTIEVYTAGGILVGDEYTITGVGGVLTSGGALLVYTDRPVRTAMTTSAKVNMMPSPWAGVIQFPATTPTGMAVGVAIYPITAAQYGWVQTHGVCSVLSDGQTAAVGSDVGTPSGTAGSITIYAAGTTHQRVGTTREAAANGNGVVAFLDID